MIAACSCSEDTTHSGSSVERFWAEGFWVAQRFSAANSCPSPDSALAAEGSPANIPGCNSSVRRSVSSAAWARTSASSQSSGMSSRISTSVGSLASTPSYSSGLISVSDTSAIPFGLRSRVPAKITSSIRDPRSVFADCSPRTQEMASAMFDFPHPFGPMMAAMPSP